MRSIALRTLFPLVVLLLALSSAEATVEAVEGGILFTYTDPNAEQVSLAGAFNNWNTSANPMTLEDGVWSVVVPLGEGKHEYKFVIDSQWVADPENPVTGGEYGNSIAHVGADGKLVTMRATANTAYSAKILLGGRMISRFVTRENPDRGGRFELNRPTMDLDLDWNIRANDYLDIHMLTSINNEGEEAVTDFWKTNLRFDRGSIHLHAPNLNILMFDNESAGRFDDPLELVGGVGIYNQDFGYRQQGLMGSTDLYGVNFRFLYADDFDNGGTSAPGLDTTSVQTSGAVFDSTAKEYRFLRNELADYEWFDDDNNRDVIALRATYPLPWLRIGSSIRFDRGQNPGSLSILEVDESDTTVTTGVQRKFGKTLEQWWGAGGDIEFGGGDRPYTVRAELLHGRAEVLGLEGRENDVALATVVEFDSIFLDTSYTSDIEDLSGERPIEDDRFEIDRSTRFLLGGDYRFEPWQLDLGASWGVETHEQTYYATSVWDTLKNRMDAVRFEAKREFEDFYGRPWSVGLGLEQFVFDYDSRTPWANQFWFDYRNFWLENGEHEVSVDRMILVGGGDASFLRPSLSTVLWAEKNLTFDYRGNFAGVDAGKKPKYKENLFTLTARPWKKIRLVSDTRLANYNDPVLELHGSYWCTFFEVAYEVAEGIEVSLSFGVDPHVVNEATNRFEPIGRDIFLFDGGANASAARRDFESLSRFLPAAEQALEDERRIQIEGIVRF